MNHLICWLTSAGSALSAAEQGLRFHEPQSFLFIASYGWSLVRAPFALAAVLVAAGVFIGFLGWPLRRFSGAIAGAALGIIIGGCYARVSHVAFVPVVGVSAVLGSVLGFSMPRTFLGFLLGAAFGLAIRALFLAFGLGEYALESFAGACLASFLMSVLVPGFWVVALSAMLGTAVAFLAAMPLVPVAPNHIDAIRIPLAAGWAVTLMVAMAVQLRVGTISVPSPRALFKRKPKKKK